MADLTSVPSQIPFTMVSGDTKTLKVKCVGTNRLPYSLAEAISIKWQVAKSVNSAAVIEKSLTDGVSSLQDGDDWYIVVEIAEEDTEDLKGTYYHECEVRFSDGGVATPFAGDLEIKQDLI